MEHKWNTLEVQPPRDIFVEVMDENGNIAMAEPTYYPFKVGKPTHGKWSSPVIPCKHYWDGGWLIRAVKLMTNIDSNIMKWRKINK